MPEASGNVIAADYLYIPFVEGTGELLVLCGAMVGAGIGFLWFNTYPAQIFMGDVGSLSMGAFIALVATNAINAPIDKDPTSPINICAG